MKKICFRLILIAALLSTNSLFALEAKGDKNIISLDFKGMDVIDVLKLIAQRGNLNIAISKNVRGKVTMFLKDVDIYDAFEIIVAANELAYEKKNGIINVMTGKDYERLYGRRFHDKRVLEAFELKYAKAAEASKALMQVKTKIGKVIVDEAANTIVIMDTPTVVAQAKDIILTLDKPVETRVFSFDWAKADEVKAKIEERLTKPIGIVQVDERTNKVIVTDMADKMAEIERLVNELDERTREVLIEAKILEVTLNDEFKWGVNWDRVFEITSKMAGIAAGVNFGDAIAGTVLPAETGSTIGSSIGIGTLTNNKYQAMIEVLRKLGRTEVLSSPRIVVVNNEEASILVGTNQPYATTGTTVSDTVSQTTQQVTYVDLGVKLHVTPTINRNGYITMKIKPEVSSKTGDIDIVSEEGTTTRTTQVPIIQTSEAETTVMVKDGNTIVLAGLIEKRVEEEVRKVPFLGDIPFIGAFFRSETSGSTDNPERKELVIFLTPHIISGEINSPEVKEYLTTPEVGKAKVIHGPLEEKKKDRGPKLYWWESKKKERREEKPAPIKKKKGIDSTGISKEGYYNLVRARVLNMASRNYSRSGISGDVYVRFKIASTGRLIGSPRILGPADETLKALALKSVIDAAPFPNFPRSIKTSSETFRILISYK